MARAGRPGGRRPMAVAVPREAATVLLLRDGPDGLETWLLRRVPKMAFAPGMSVFPGRRGGPGRRRRAGAGHRRPRSASGSASPPSTPRC